MLLNNLEALLLAFFEARKTTLLVVVCRAPALTRIGTLPPPLERAQASFLGPCGVGETALGGVGGVGGVAARRRPPHWVADAAVRAVRVHTRRAVTGEAVARLPRRWLQTATTTVASKAQPMRPGHHGLEVNSTLSIIRRCSAAVDSSVVSRGSLPGSGVRVVVVVVAVAAAAAAAAVVVLQRA
eukprot:COSAG01_NODE_23159_length_826_cov_0.976616_1_plen_183_part_10